MKGINFTDMDIKKLIVIQEVIDGKWGSGDTRKKRLIEAGYDYDAVQKRVNELVAKPYSGVLPTTKLVKSNVVKDMQLANIPSIFVTELVLKSPKFKFLKL